MEIENGEWYLIFANSIKKTIGDFYPLPNIIDILDQLGSTQYFSVFDLASGFHQIKMSPEDSHKTVFSTPYGHYEFDICHLVYKMHQLIFSD